MSPESSLHGTIRRTLLTGLSEIDNDHLHFADLSAELLSACAAGDAASIEAVARALELHATSHFSSEEHLLNEFGYGEYDPVAFASHVAEHERLRDLIAEILSQPTLTAADATAIQTSLAEHLLIWDVKYMSFIHRLGLAFASPESG